MRMLQRRLKKTRHPILRHEQQLQIMLGEGIKVRVLFEASIAFIAYSLQYHTRKYCVY